MHINKHFPISNSMRFEGKMYFALLGVKWGCKYFFKNKIEKYAIIIMINMVYSF